MKITDLIKARRILGSYLAEQAITVGKGGMFATALQAVNYINAVRPSPFRITSLGVGTDTYTVTLTATNGSPVVSSATTIVGAVDYFFKTTAGSRFYKIKKKTASNAIELWENYADASIAGVPTEYSIYALDIYTIVLLPGTHLMAGLDIPHGVNLCSIDKNNTFISESSGTPATPLGAFGATSVFNVSFQPNWDWGDMDGLVGSIKNDMWAGEHIRFYGVDIMCSNKGGVHSGGSLRLPMANGCFTEYRNCRFGVSKTPNISGGGAVTATTTNSFISIKDSEFFHEMDADSHVNNQLFPATLLISAPGTYNIENTKVDMIDNAIQALVGTVGPISVQHASALVNINKLNMNIANTNAGDNCYGIEVTAAATVNIAHSNIDVGGTNGTGIYNNGGTVNVRTGCRVKGTTNSINCASGTVNVSGNADLIGTTTGAGTINLATAT